MVALVTLVNELDTLLKPGAYSDYAPNGLQVEGRAEVRRLVTGVTASLELLEAAVAAQADAVLVHHGYFWKGESPCITGIKRRRLQTLLQHDISLLAYHLPLDDHHELGNNRQLARQLGLIIDGQVAVTGAGVALWHGRLPQPLAPQQCADWIAQRLGRTPQLLAAPSRPQVSTLAWCSGAAQQLIDDAARLGVDAYISGEVSEQTWHSAREGGINYFAAGHHATERYGVMALGTHLAGQFAIEHRFIDIENPL
ncbi:MAG: Nif3-like dinuclear metal center hexameric protein [Gammaproteobacteria bacterium]|nr:Nif3-like dinuclear metal center hexameric protein [Gammaproteobacteria bacterium]